MARIALRRAAFRAWLRGQEPQEEVGRTMDGTRCPLACFLIAQGARHPLVDKTTYEVTLSVDAPRRMPGWAREFVDSVDEAGWGRVTAAEALAVLETIP